MSTALIPAKHALLVLGVGHLRTSGQPTRASLCIPRAAAAPPARTATVVRPTASEESHTESPTTAKKCSFSLCVGRATVAVRAGGAAAHRRVHGDARVGCPDVEKWPTCWPRTPAAGLGTKGSQQGLVGSWIPTRLSFYPYGSWGRHISSRSDATTSSGNRRTVRPHGHAQLRAFSTTRSESS